MAKLPIEPTPKHYVTGLVQDNQLPRMTKIECTHLGLSYTDKSKHVIGCSPTHKVVWAWPNFSQNDHKLFVDLTKAYGMEDDRILGARIVMDWFETNRAQIVEDVNRYRSRNMTLEMAIQKRANLRRELEEAEALINSVTPVTE
jgi:hypothetical protein